jgi:AraC family transcriptional regulator, transcriptional activator of pobA
MDKAQSIEDFYLSKLNWMPEDLKKEMGHFNVFRLDDFVGCKAKPVPYNRKDYYKISLVVGHNRVHYADRTIEIEKQALLFASPLIPYSWEPLDEEQSGFFCIYTEAFFDQFGNIKDYPMFQPGGNPVFALSDQQLEDIRRIYLKMLEEIASDYVYKYHVLRNLVFELIHSALKMQPATTTLYRGSNAAMRVSSLFTELLERQFPIESPLQRVQFRSPLAFADQLSVHVNHLNRSLKEITGKTTSQLIAERMVQEARTLLRHTDWNISEISWCLGFEELSHFIHFFKKNADTTPSSFRRVVV